jgi:hypothetical protein
MPASRNPWPIAIIASFAIFFISLAVFITWAVRQNMDLVRKDYYDEEIRYQDQLDRLNRTEPWRGQVAVTYDHSQSCITITLPAMHAARQPRGQVHLYRPSDARLDQHLDLAVNAEGIQRVDARTLRPGLWKVRLRWQANGEEFYFDQSIVVGRDL